MTQVEDFQIGDIDGCEFATSRNVGHMLLSWGNTSDDKGWGKVLVVFSDGSSGSVTQDDAQSKLDSGQWKVYRP